MLYKKLIVSAAHVVWTNKLVLSAERRDIFIRVPALAAAKASQNFFFFFFFHPGRMNQRLRWKVSLNVIWWSSVTNTEAPQKLYFLEGGREEPRSRGADSGALAFTFLKGSCRWHRFGAELLSCCLQVLPGKSPWKPVAKVILYRVRFYLL